MQHSQEPSSSNSDAGSEENSRIQYPEKKLDPDPSKKKSRDPKYGSCIFNPDRRPLHPDCYLIPQSALYINIPSSRSKIVNECTFFCTSPELHDQIICEFMNSSLKWRGRIRLLSKYLLWLVANVDRSDPNGSLSFV